jgi:hypothetical protein
MYIRVSLHLERAVCTIAIAALCSMHASATCTIRWLSQCAETTATV